MKLVPWTRQSLLEDRWAEPFKILEGMLADWPGPDFFTGREGTLFPAVDILEKDGNLILKAELPGVHEKDIHLTLEGGRLTLKGEKRSETEEKGNNFHRRESVHGSFSRSFSLPETVDPDEVKADYKNGVLTVTIPQKPEVRPREIAVQAS